jgi:hypothetical protein
MDGSGWLSVDVCAYQVLRSESELNSTVDILGCVGEMNWVPPQVIIVLLRVPLVFFFLARDALDVSTESVQTKGKQGQLGWMAYEEGST